MPRPDIYYGIDLQKLDVDDLVGRDGTLLVHLPEPEELDFTVDLDSMRFISKRSGLMVIADWFLNLDQEEQLRRQFKSAALGYMRQENLIPGKQDILARLSTFGELLSESVGLDVVFQ